MSAKVTNINKPENEAAEVAETTENSADTYTYTFKKPVLHDGEGIKEITFNWGKLNGMDFLKIDAELKSNSTMAIFPEYSPEFCIGMAVRASEPRVDLGFFQRVPIGAFNKIVREARNFLQRTV